MRRSASSLWLACLVLASHAPGCSRDVARPPTSPAAPRAPAAAPETAAAVPEPVAPETAPAPAPELPPAPVPPPIRLSLEDEEAIDAAVHAELEAGTLPGAVVLIGRSDGVLFRRAYGLRARIPEPEAMTEDTIFDLASLTKAVATTAAVMALVEDGQVRLDAPVARYLPAFGRRGKHRVTVRQLLTHTGGLPSVNPLRDYEGGREAAIDAILDTPLDYPPGEYARYTDLGFIVLGELVAEVAGRPLPAVAHDRLFGPLGMADTCFLPDPGLRPRIALTELREDGPARGEVGDPRAWRLGNVAGNAGLFSTADDLARYARMLLAGGALDGTRVLAAETVAEMTRPQTLPNGARRGLGWDMSPHTAQGMSLRSFGHGGYTGTWLWVDPERDLYVVFLSNRVHAEEPGSVQPLRTEIARIASAAERRVGPLSPVPVLTGVDVLRRDRLASLRGARVGLITNRSGRARDGRTTLSVLHRAPEVTLAAIFAPEHGLGGDREGHVEGGVHEETGVPLYSLFGRQRTPPPESLEGLDALVFDVQDAGTRFYTYGSTMRRAMEAAASRGIRFVVLDRPNPQGGERVEGPLVDEAYESFVNHHPLPILHGLTLGELAHLLAEERGIDVALEVVPMEGWERSMRFAETGLRWVPPSPNLRTVEQTLLYPAVGLLEGTNVSVGRGTRMPFEVIGAPWVRARSVARALGEVPGLEVTPTRFRPRQGPHRREVCAGLRFALTDAEAYDPVRTSLALALAMASTHPDDFALGDLDRMLADEAALAALGAGETPERITALWADELAAFRERRAAHLRY